MKVNNSIQDIVLNGAEADTEQSNFPYPLNALRNRAENVRVCGKIAKFLIMHQVTVEVAGKKRNLQIKSVGLDVYHVKLKEESSNFTSIVKLFK